MKSNLGDFADIEVTRQIVDSAVEVHRHLGPGLLESAYRACLIHELECRELKTRSEVSIPIVYKGIIIDSPYRADIVVEDGILLELKSVEVLLPIHAAQILTYLKLTKLRVGFLMNFNVPRLMSGLRRFVR